jgi:cation transport regulator ChaC
MSSEDNWYFAYGSNLNVDQKEFRTGTIRKAVRCHLKHYRLAFNKRSGASGVAANIMPQDGQIVWGVAYLCSAEALSKMDSWEGVASGHYRRANVQVQTGDGGTLNAIAYIAEDKYVTEESRPSDEYLQKIISGAQHHAFPQEYIEAIKRLAGR